MTRFDRDDPPLDGVFAEYQGDYWCSLSAHDPAPDSGIDFLGINVCVPASVVAALDREKTDVIANNLKDVFELSHDDALIGSPAMVLRSVSTYPGWFPRGKC